MHKFYANRIEDELKIPKNSTSQGFKSEEAQQNPVLRCTRDVKFCNGVCVNGIKDI